MAILIPVQYQGIKYPPGITPEIKEESAPLWIPRLKRFAPKYSLHTDPSASGKPNQKFPLLDRFPTIKKSYEEGIPQLWFNKKWAEEFAEFIKLVVGKTHPPLIIEIHSPYRDYCASFEQFLERYLVFEDRVSLSYPEAEILIENRCGTEYKRSSFLVSSYREVAGLYEQLEGNGYRLGLVIDFPQLLDQIRMTSLTIGQLEGKIKEIFEVLKPCRKKIRGIHLWGPKRVVDGGFKGVHKEDLNGLFRGYESAKMAFLKGRWGRP